MEGVGDGVSEGLGDAFGVGVGCTGGAVGVVSDVPVLGDGNGAGWAEGVPVGVSLGEG